ncbi:amidohydrolase family protein [Mycobacterium sherrisii]|uniref:Amidohydrolase n=1 Tax=Mycobacterium sherrisii TaxID=243061 RepID=A0A1E3T0V1_9MYCO|nr:amidohydrolase family protein [Mycobacterium sherrisii]MCV7028111.1 amidohydrolase family protein [Mycobacterium sherrisii]MEC4762729.1 amidohydrolase family protein [Mycobacterium sherrisii]ODR07453.1 amidohydrolase [Mycobacterium sherrisii]ORW78763.1 amidohydrolase [Mycobacterium sherrisii]
MLIQRVTLLDGTATDIRVGARIEEIGTGLAVRPGETVLDGRGGTVLPGLHDHHVHLRSAASAIDSVQLGPPAVTTKDQLGQALSRAAPGPDGWIRAVGYHDSVAGELDRAALDAVMPNAPVRVQHRSGALWILNSAALRLLEMADHPDGRLRAADPWSRALARRHTDLAELSRRLVALGITGVTDATPELGADDMVSLMMAHRHGEFWPRIAFLAPGKIILHDDQLDLEALTEWITGRHRDGQPVAVHCVTAAQLVVTIAALRAAGTHPRDRIEHAAVVADDNLADLADLGVTVVTQPNFVAERGDQYLAEVPAAEHDQLWRVASLCKANVGVALSTDAPFGRGDPWAAMRAAVHRTTPSGSVLGINECVSAPTALAMFFGWADQPAHPRAVEVGQPGDLCVLSAPPAAALAELDAELVSATVIAGTLAYVVA